MQNCLETFIFTLFQRRYSELIHENLRELGLNVELAAEALGVRPTTLLDLLTEEEGLSPETAFDLSIDILLRRQQAGEFDVKKFTP